MCGPLQTISHGLDVNPSEFIPQKVSEFAEAGLLAIEIRDPITGASLSLLATRYVLFYSNDTLYQMLKLTF
jgi:hypothetical protein